MKTQLLAKSPSLKSLFPIIGLLLLFISSAPAAINYQLGGIATAEYDVTEPAKGSFTIADLDDWVAGGDFAVNSGQVPEFRIEFENNSEVIRMVNTWFAPIAVSDELSGGGLRQFALNEEINAAVTWGAIGRLETQTETTVWNTNSQGYAGFRVGNAGDYYYGWALLDYRDNSDEIELVAMAIETELNTPIQAGAVPEPSSIFVLLPAVAFVATARRRRRH